MRGGRAVGAADHGAAARAGWTAVALGFGFAFFPTAAFLFLGPIVIFLVLPAREHGRIDLAVSFLIAAAFQLVDSVQIIARGALQGLKDTRVPMLIALAGYWGLGLTSAALFGVYLGFGGQAIWGGMAVSLLVVGALLVRRFRARSLRSIDAPRLSA